MEQDGAAASTAERPRQYGKFIAAGPNENGSIIAVVFEGTDGHQIELGCDAAQFSDAILAFQKAAAHARGRRRSRGIRR